MHEEQLNVVDVLDEKRLVAGRSHVAGLLVRTVTDLNPPNPSTTAHSDVIFCARRHNPKAIKEEYSVPRAWQPDP